MLLEVFLALLDFVSKATVVAQASFVGPLTLVSQKPLHGSRSNFVESYLFAISPDRFLALVVCTTRGYSILNWAPVFGGVRSVSVVRNCEANKHQKLWRGSFPPYLLAYFCC